MSTLLLAIVAVGLFGRLSQPSTPLHYTINGLELEGAPRLRGTALNLGDQCLARVGDRQMQLEEALGPPDEKFVSFAWDEPDYLYWRKARVRVAVGREKALRIRYFEFFDNFDERYQAVHEWSNSGAMGSPLAF